MKKQPAEEFDMHLTIRKMSKVPRCNSTPYYKIESDVITITAFNWRVFESYGLCVGDTIHCRIKILDNGNKTHFNLVAVHGREMASKQFVQERMNELKVSVFQRQWEIAKAQGDVEAEKKALQQLSQIL